MNPFSSDPMSIAMAKIRSFEEGATIHCDLFGRGIYTPVRFLEWHLGGAIAAIETSNGREYIGAENVREAWE